MKNIYVNQNIFCIFGTTKGTNPAGKSKKMRTYKEAKKAQRSLVKGTVKRYLESETNFNWTEFGSKIIKKEIYHAYKRYSIINYKSGYCVVGLDNQIIAI